MTVAYIFLNGPLNHALPSAPPEGSLVIAADGGARHVLELGWPLDYLVGDFDSLDPESLTLLRLRPDLKIHTHPKDKDETDFELALDLALDFSKDLVLNTLKSQCCPEIDRLELHRLEILGALGGRWDMTISNLLLPLADKYNHFHHFIFRDSCDLHVLSAPFTLNIHFAPHKRLISIMPLNGDAFLSLFGPFKYPLVHGHLFLGLTRGLSNVLGPEEGEIQLEEGQILVTISPLDEA